MNFYATFSIPFIVGVVTMFVVLIVKYGSWIFGLSAADRMRIVKGIPSRQTPLAVWEVVRESLLHRRIFKVNPDRKSTRLNSSHPSSSRMPSSA